MTNNLKKMKQKNYLLINLKQQQQKKTFCITYGSDINEKKNIKSNLSDCFRISFVRKHSELKILHF